MERYYPKPQPTRTFIGKHEKALVILSGGQDSTTCLFWALQTYPGDILCVTFDYGQRHAIEIEAAVAVVDFARKMTGRLIDHEIIKVPDILWGTSPLVSKNKLEEYKDYNSLPGGLEKTFVPMRNQFFITLAANYAFCSGISTLVTGVCQEDFGGYPDCRRVFIDLLRDACNAGTFNAEAGFPQGLFIETPLMYLTKAESVRLAVDLKYAYAALALTHTAYDGQYPPTGKDHASLLRAKGFAEAGYPDPLVLRAATEGLMELPRGENYGRGVIKGALALMDFEPTTR